MLGLDNTHFSQLCTLLDERAPAHQARLLPGAGSAELGLVEAARAAAAVAHEALVALAAPVLLC